MWPKPEFAGSTFLTKESDSTPEPNTSKLVGYTVSPDSKFIMHFPKFPPKATIRFTGMDRYKLQKILYIRSTDLIKRNQYTHNIQIL